MCPKGPPKSIVNLRIWQDKNGGERIVHQKGAAHRSIDDSYAEVKDNYHQTLSVFQNKLEIWIFTCLFLILKYLHHIQTNKSSVGQTTINEEVYQLTSRPNLRELPSDLKRQIMCYSKSVLTWFPLISDLLMIVVLMLISSSCCFTANQWCCVHICSFLDFSHWSAVWKKGEHDKDRGDP